MERRRKQQLFLILVLMFSVVSFSIGFAAFSVSLNVSPSASVTPNSSNFIVKFSTDANEIITDKVTPINKTSGVEASDGIIDNQTNPVLKNIQASFTTPGQSVEYIVYARNEGEYTAYLNNITFYGEKVCEQIGDTSLELISSACESINIVVYINGQEYKQTTEISNHALLKNTSEEVKIKLEYSDNGIMADGPFSVNFSNILLTYSTIDDSTFISPDGPTQYIKLADIIKENATIDTNIDFSDTTNIGTLNNNAYILNSTINNTYPIYYYRGNVSENNVLFANKCWKIVRTTETGGIKIIYNGIPSSNNTCDNTGTSSQLESLSSFNTGYTAPTYGGYMYGDVYKYNSKDMTVVNDNIIYANDIYWDGNQYILEGEENILISSAWDDDRMKLASRYHYTCFNTSGICTEVYYIHHFGSLGKSYYLKLSNGNDIEVVKQQMFSNVNNSTIKNTLDEWYVNNIKEYSYKLEDTVFCNDRTFSGGSLKGKDENATTHYSTFSSHERNYDTKKPSLVCDRKQDSFTVGSSLGNGNLLYPIGLLTADELTYAGSSSSGDNSLSYLNIGTDWLTMTPAQYTSYHVAVFYLNNTGLLRYESANYSYGIRPVVSLRNNTQIISGKGTTSEPYIVY